MRTGRKVTGGKYKKARKKRLYEIAGKTRFVKIGEGRRKTLRMRAGKERVVLLSTDKVNLFDPKTKKTEIVKIKTVVETPSNRYFARRNIMTKGSIVETERGKARITNRPGQEGSVNAVLLE